MSVLLKIGIYKQANCQLKKISNAEKKTLLIQIKIFLFLTSGEWDGRSHLI